MILWSASPLDLVVAFWCIDENRIRILRFKPNKHLMLCGPSATAINCDCAPLYGKPNGVPNHLSYSVLRCSLCLIIARRPSQRIVFAIDRQLKLDRYSPTSEYNCWAFGCGERADTTNAIYIYISIYIPEFVWKIIPHNHKYRITYIHSVPTVNGILSTQICDIRFSFC